MTDVSDKDFDPNTKQVNGPINVVRMEGKINGINKVIYLFMDQHLQAQTQCDNVFSVDINTYFANTFHKLNKSNKMYDFFLEINPTQLIDPINQSNQSSQLPKQPPAPAPIKSNYRNIYIFEVMRLFKRIFKYEPNSDKVSISKYFRKVRLHYMDIRDYFHTYVFVELYEVMHILYHIQSMNKIFKGQLDQLLNFLKRFRSHCQMIKTEMESMKKNPIKPDNKILIGHLKHDISQEEKDKMSVENIRYILYKSFYRYNHKDVQKKMIVQMGRLISELVELSNQCDDIINILTNIGYFVIIDDNVLTKINDEISYGTDHLLPKMIFSIAESFRSLNNNFVKFFARFMDVYFIRRFLDKEYITNAITYTGSVHSMLYIEILSKNFGFKVTNYYWSLIKDLDDLNREIVKLNFEELQEIFYPPVRAQCSDLTSFPDNFE